MAIFFWYVSYVFLYFACSIDGDKVLHVPKTYFIVLCGHTVCPSFIDRKDKPNCPYKVLLCFSYISFKPVTFSYQFPQSVCRNKFWVPIFLYSVKMD